MKRRRTDPTFTGTRDVCLLSPDPRGFRGVTRRNFRQSAEFCFERTMTVFHTTSQHVEVFPAKELLLCSACALPPAVRDGILSFKSSSLRPPEEKPSWPAAPHSAARPKPKQGRRWAAPPGGFVLRTFFSPQYLTFPFSVYPGDRAAAA